MGSNSNKLRSKKTNLVGAYLRKSGKYSSEIKDSLSKKRVWLGTFSTPEEASRAYLAKKREFQEKKNAKPSTQDSPSSLLQNQEIQRSDAAVGEGVSGENKIEFGFFNGVRVVDLNGFLVGEFSTLDDFTICTTEDGAVYYF